MKRALLFLILFLLSASFVLAQDDYYADLVIDVRDTGLVRIEGSTNNELLDVEASADFTSKEGRNWLLNISPQGVFGDAVFEIHLPEAATINYLKVPDLLRVEDAKDGIVIVAVAHNQSVQLLVQYQVTPPVVKAFPWLLVIFLFIALSLGATLWRIKRQYAQQRAFRSSIAHLTHRQRRIILTLKKNKGKMLQSELELKLGWPKSSLSRNVDALVRQGMIEKRQSGMSNMLFLKK